MYAITPEENNTDRLLQKVALAFQGGARVLQYRNKTGSLELRQVQAQVLRELSREYNVPLIINDDALLAKQVDADGVHLGGEDGSIAAARALLGADKLIGVSCYNQLNLARIAAGQGADYFAFGAFYASTIKPDACIASLELLKQARREFTRPLVAIGGINPENAMPLLAAGADALAVISALFSSPDIQQAAMQFNLTIMAGKPLSR